MRCYKCGSFLYENDFCSECGTDVSMYKKIVKKSNEMYNRGLSYARDRNLSGAVQCLEVALRMYKGNINARNLLGLVYVEMGEYARGLAQWIISKNMLSDNNMADYFLNQLQNDRHALNLMNVTIRKYNKAVNYVKQGNYDLAEIQLKKLLNDNPNMVEGHQLLGLLLLKKQKYAEARLALRKAQRIDEGNPVTISYMTAVNDEIRSEEQDLTPAELRTKRAADRIAEEDAEHAPLSGDDVIIPKSSYREYNPVTMAIIQIIIGVVVGAAIIFFVVMPAKTRQVRQEFIDNQNRLENEVSSLLEVSSSYADALTATTAPPATTTAATEPTTTQSSAEAQQIETLLASAEGALSSGDYEGARAYLNGIQNPNALTGEQATRYSEISRGINNLALELDIQEGINYYNAGVATYTDGGNGTSNANFQTAVDLLQSAYNSGADSEETLYYLGRSYDYLNDGNNTLLYLREYVQKYPYGQYITTSNQIITAWTNMGYN